MSYKLHTPCSDCPFLKVGGIRLMPARARELIDGALSTQGATFDCHKTVDYDEDGEGRSTPGTQHCAGALIFSEKHGIATQMMRIAERLGLYDPSKLTGHELVFDSRRQMMAAQLKKNKVRKRY